MNSKLFSMSASQIANVVGTVGSPLIVVAELLKNAVDASATQIDIFYNCNERSIVIENDYKGFSLDEIEMLSMPGESSKKAGNNLTNERGMFLTGSKGLGLLSVFLLCNRAVILTAPDDQRVHRIVLDKVAGTIEEDVTDHEFERHFTRITLEDVNEEIIEFLSSEAEVKKLRHISTYLYKYSTVPFPKMILHISGTSQASQEINFSCLFPSMLYDVSFCYQKQNSELRFRCFSPNKPINNEEIVLTKFDIDGLQDIMLEYYGIKETILTRTNELRITNFGEVPSFEGRILVYEKNLAGAQLKTYGAGVNVYVNEFALYNYLAEENDWLGLADYSQRKKVTRLKPHNVFGYVNFPHFNENEETLRISNERADFIQDLTFTKLMYLLKGVVMFAILNIDVADKNPKYKESTAQEKPEPEQSKAQAQPQPESEQSSTSCDEQPESTEQANNEHENEVNVEPETGDSQPEASAYSPESAYKPKQNVQNRLVLTQEEGVIISRLRDVDDLSNKIYNIVFELSRLELQSHRYSIACLYRSILESATKYLSKSQPAVLINKDALEQSITSALNYFSNTPKGKNPLSPKTVAAWRETVSKRKLVDILNEYIHNELPVDSSLLQETWRTMKGYVIACLTLS